MNCLETLALSFFSLYLGPVAPVMAHRGANNNNTERPFAEFAPSPSPQKKLYISPITGSNGSPKAMAFRQAKIHS